MSMSDTAVARLHVHVEASTSVTAEDYLSERRTVLLLGDSPCGVAVFLREAELARLVQVASDALSRLTGTASEAAEVSAA